MGADLLGTYGALGGGTFTSDLGTASRALLAFETATAAVLGFSGAAIEAGATGAVFGATDDFRGTGATRGGTRTGCALLCRTCSLDGAMCNS